MRRFVSGSSRLGLGVFALGCAGLWGCVMSPGGSDTVSPTINFIDRTTQALSAAGSFVAVRGAYGTGCSYRSASGKWSVPVGTAAGIEDPLLLAVQRNDKTCMLTLESIEGEPAGERKLFSATSALLMTESYPVGAASFNYMSDPAAFFASAKLRSSAGSLFSSDFFIDIVYSEDPAHVDRDILGQYARVLATAQATNVPTPSYTADTSSLLLQVDAQKKLDISGAGNVTLTVASQAGRMYALTQTDPGTTLDSIDAAYTNAAIKLNIAGSPVNIAANAFGLTAGTQLPQTWYVIVTNYNDTAPNVRSYLVFRLQFQPPP